MVVLAVLAVPAVLVVLVLALLLAHVEFAAPVTLSRQAPSFLRPVVR